MSGLIMLKDLNDVIAFSATNRLAWGTVNPTTANTSITSCNGFTAAATAAAAFAPGAAIINYQFTIHSLFQCMADTR